jgi:limonene 1,2-monooxygenase
MDWPLRAGIFMAPFHPPTQNPTLALERDLQLIEHLDRLGIHEAWIGEHHSAGYEIIASPELFIAAAAGRTSHINLGTGVISLPYHHPFMTAQRIVLLDHLTRGRVLFGVGPGALPSDAFMLGIHPSVQRDRMDEALGTILELFRSPDPVSRDSEWFQLNEARLHLLPYSDPHPEVAVAAMISPSGPRTAGTHGCSLLSIGATQRAGIDLLGQHWNVYDETAQEHGHSVDRQAWRLVSQVHLAETKEQAYRDVEFGLGDYAKYFREVAALPFFPDGPASDLAEQMNNTGGGVIGTPDDCIEFIEMLIEQSNGGFGTLLIQAHEWANTEATHRSYELFARYVLPHFDKKTSRPAESMTSVMAKRDEQMGAAMGAIGDQFNRLAADRAAKAAEPAGTGQ